MDRAQKIRKLVGPGIVPEQAFTFPTAFASTPVVTTMPVTTVSNVSGATVRIVAIEP